VYDIIMKYIVLAIFVLFAAQPLQASSCDMHDAQDTSHSQHGDNGHAMDCCDDDPSGSADGCDSMSHCGASIAAGVTIDSTPLNVIFAASSYQHLADPGPLQNKIYSPPFRPPIT
jgi:hypothetical protein